MMIVTPFCHLLLSEVKTSANVSVCATSVISLYLFNLIAISAEIVKLVL